MLHKREVRVGNPFWISGWPDDLTSGTSPVFQYVQMLCDHVIAAGSPVTVFGLRLFYSAIHWHTHTYIYILRICVLVLPIEKAPCYRNLMEVTWWMTISPPHLLVALDTFLSNIFKQIHETKLLALRGCFTNPQAPLVEQVAGIVLGAAWQVI